jgi:AraC-like DNA-binding protein
MISCLASIRNWNDLAREAVFEVGKLAALCRVSDRQLRRYFISRFGKNPKAWLDEARLREAARLLAEGETLKGVTYALGFVHAAHFCRTFKRHYHITPRQFLTKQRTESAVMSENVNDVRSC